MSNRAERSIEKVTRELERGDRQLLEQLRRMVVRMNGTADRDLEQEVFLRVLEAFRRRSEIRYPHALMRKIARDTIVDSWRSRARVPTANPDGTPEWSTQGMVDIEGNMDRERRLDLLRESILDLGCDIRGPVYLFYVEQYPIAAIARLFGKSPSAVKMALHRGRKRLGKMLGNPGSTATKKVGDNAKATAAGHSTP
jgi:RNA polymerase sigma factor (sigma-70 family)